MWQPSWEPFWQAVDEVRLPLHFHTFPTTPPRARQEAPQVRRGDVHRRLGGPDGAHPHHGRNDGGGRVRALSTARVSFGESGAGWLAYALHRMDFEFEVDTPLARRLLLRSEPAVREDRGAGR